MYVFLYYDNVFYIYYPGPAHEGIDSYSAQEGIDSKGNIIEI